MKVYLDICCLKRPFDDQRQQRVQLETVAVLAVMAATHIEFMHAPAHDLENSLNPVAWRAARVQRWLDSKPLADLNDAPLTARTADLVGLGFKNFDAFHLACAELAGADVFSTCDDRLLAVARRNPAALAVRVVDPIQLHAEVHHEHD